MECAEALSAMEPFGHCNPRPLLDIGGFTLLEEPRVLKERHLKLHLCARGGRSVWAIGFGLGHRAAELRCGTLGLRIAGSLVVNRWGGQKRAEIDIKDFCVQDDAAKR